MADSGLATLYTYHCVDGCVRTRCEQHIEQSGPYAILQRDKALYHRRPVRGRCVRCDWEERQQRRRVTVENKIEGNGDD
jgi:hypothetical protein